MTTVTLEEVKAAQTKLAAMIATLEANQPRVFDVAAQSIELMPGEHYAGLILGKEGEASYHLILLPGEAESVNWANAKKFAEKAGGELPSRREQSLLFANCGDQFAAAWYWSAETHASGSDCAWMQHFGGGRQSGGHKGLTCRARAVRRLAI